MYVFNLPIIMLNWQYFNLLDFGELNVYLFESLMMLNTVPLS